MWTLLIATDPLIGRSRYFNLAYTWLQPWAFIPSIAGFVGLTFPLCCGYSPHHVFSSDNSCHPAMFPNFLFCFVFKGLELLVPHCAGRTRAYTKSVGFRSLKRSCHRYRLFLLTPNTRQTALTPSPSLSACTISTMRESGVFRFAKGVLWVSEKYPLQSGQ